MIEPNSEAGEYEFRIIGNFGNMAKTAKKKPAPKKEQPLKINGSLDDVLKASFSKPQPIKKEEKK